MPALATTDLGGHFEGMVCGQDLLPALLRGTVAVSAPLQDVVQQPRSSRACAFEVICKRLTWSCFNASGVAKLPALLNY